MSFLDNRFVNNTVKASGLILLSTSPYSCGNCDKNPSEPKIAPAPNRPAPAPAPPAPPVEKIYTEYGTEFYMDIEDFKSQEFEDEKRNYIDDIRKNSKNLNLWVERLFGEGLLEFKVNVSNFFKKLNAFYPPKLRKELDEMDMHEKSIKLLSLVQDPENSTKQVSFMDALQNIKRLRINEYLQNILSSQETILNNPYIKNQLKNSILPICIALNKYNYDVLLMRLEVYTYCYKTDINKFTNLEVNNFAAELKTKKLELMEKTLEFLKKDAEYESSYDVQKWLEKL